MNTKIFFILILFLSCPIFVTAQSSTDSISKLPLWKQMLAKREINKKSNKQYFKTYKYWKNNREHNVDLLLSFPYFNWYSSAPDVITKRERNFGFIGLGAGLEYFYKKNTSLTLKWNGTMTFLAPVPAPVDYGGGCHTHVMGMDLNLLQTHYINFMSLGYGICVARNNWSYQVESDQKNDEEDCDYGLQDLHYKRYAIGTPIYLYGHITKVISAGLNYRPTFYRIGSPKPWKYEHLISIDVQFRISTSRKH